MIETIKKTTIDNIYAYFIVLVGIGFFFPLEALGVPSQYYVFAFGLKILVFLIYGVSILPAIILAKLTYMLLMSDIGSDPMLAIHLSLISATAPAIAMYAMNMTNVNTLKNLSKIDFRHVIFFIGLTSILSSLTKYIYISNFMPLDAEAAAFLSNYLLGHLISGFVVVYLAVKLVPNFYLFIAKFAMKKN
jgi:hypothetical protein